MAELLVISGPPGSGKSTVAALLADRLQPSVLVESDAFFGFLRGGIDPWRPESDDQNRTVIRAGAASVGAFVRGGIATVYEGVLGPWYLDELVVGTGLDAIDYAVLLPPLDVCQQRVSSRIDHPFDDPEVTAHLHQQFASSLLDPRHVIAAEAPAVDVVAAVLDAQAAGRLRRLAPAGPT